MSDQPAHRRLVTAILPRHEQGKTVIEPPGIDERPAHARPDLAPPGPSPPGAWAGAPSTLTVDGVVWLAYRLAAPGHAGYANVLARSRDGLRFETVLALGKERFGAMSLQRPAFALTPEGRWRLYVSCATPGTKHWRVELLEAGSPEGLAAASPRTVLPGDPRAVAVKDPVLLRAGGRWHLWASCHPLDDRMTTEYATSDDGVTWTWRGTALRGRAGMWDARGARITAVLIEGDAAVALYDGRASAEQNWEERTGVAVGGLDRAAVGRPLFRPFTAVGDGPAAAAPHGAGGLRYVAVAQLPAGGRRLYYEATRAGGAHELRTQLVDD